MWLRIVLLISLTSPLAADSLHKVYQDAWGDFGGIMQCWAAKTTAYLYPEPEFPRKESTGIPVILVHGYLHDNSGWVAFRKQLEEKNIGPIFAPTLLDSGGDIVRSSLEIAQIVRFVKLQTGSSSVILVGHSMGGLVSAYATQYLLEPGEVQAVITLASPLKGTKIARLGFSKAARQMEIGSRFTSELVAKMKKEPKTRYFCFGSARDEVVIPHKNAFFRTSDPDDLLYTTVGHQSFLFDPEVIQDVSLLLEQLSKRDP